jgi:hypothetical protein
VVKRQVLWREDVAAILASVMVAQQYVFAREALSLERNVNVFDQTYDGRRRHRKPRRVQPVSAALLGMSNAFKHEHDCATHRTYVDWLERCVEN